MRKVTLAIVLTALCGAQTGTLNGIDTTALDTTCEPCQDFYRYATGGWTDKNPIPDDRARWSTFDELTEAHHESLSGKPAPVIDGFTGDQRFFLAFARVLAESQRPAFATRQLATDPRPLPKYRVNATLQKMPEFYAAFQCRDGDPMVRPAAEQCKLW
jgi:predicted metalloendopeptidase